MQWEVRTVSTEFVARSATLSRTLVLSGPLETVTANLESLVAQHLAKWLRPWQDGPKNLILTLRISPQTTSPEGQKACSAFTFDIGDIPTTLLEQAIQRLLGSSSQNRGTESRPESQGS